MARSNSMRRSGRPASIGCVGPGTPSDGSSCLTGLRWALKRVTTALRQQRRSSTPTSPMSRSTGRACPLSRSTATRTSNPADPQGASRAGPGGGRREHERNPGVEYRGHAGKHPGYAGANRAPSGGFRRRLSRCDRLGRIRPAARRHWAGAESCRVLQRNRGQGMADHGGLRVRPGPDFHGDDLVRPDQDLRSMGSSSAPLVGTDRRRTARAGSGALLVALGFQGYSGRVLLHSILGCFFFGAFVAKMLILTRDDSPGWALPAVGGAVFSAFVALWMTAALWFFATNGVTT